MKHIDQIDISRRCGIKPENTVFDFSEKITDEWVNKKFKKLIAYGIDPEKFKPYVDSKLKDVPKEILDGYSPYFFTDGEDVYLYEPCCM